MVFLNPKDNIDVYSKKEVIIFDLDNTLARSKTIIDAVMRDLLCELLSFKKVVVISGGSFHQFKKELIDPLTCTDHFSNLHIFPTDGTAYYAWNGTWNQIYEEPMKDEDKIKIISTLKDVMALLKIPTMTKYGEQIEDRISQVTFSGLGQEAPLELKEVWDPERTMRLQMKKLLDERLPGFEIRVAGTTSEDITLANRDKAYAIKKILDVFHIPLDSMLYIGDALFVGGNDYPVISTGIDVMSVDGPEDTKIIIKNIIKNR